MNRRWSHACLLAVAALAPCQPARGQALEEVITPDREISRGYDTWSLFLICNPAWARPDAVEQIENMWNAFVGFGRTIGANNLAVWFWRRQPRWGQAALVEDVDIERSAAYCQLYGLDPSRSPHVLVTTSYPTLDERVDDYGTVELAGADPAQIDQFLISLADALYAGDLASLDPGTESFWFRLFEAIRGPIRRLAGVSVTIESGPLKLVWTGNQR